LQQYFDRNLVLHRCNNHSPHALICHISRFTQITDVKLAVEQGVAGVVYQMCG
jgi:hypothetical protein